MVLQLIPDAKIVQGAVAVKENQLNYHMMGSSYIIWILNCGNLISGVPVGGLLCRDSSHVRVCSETQGA